MARYTVTIYVRLSYQDRARPVSVQVEADDSAGAQQAAIDQCENACIIHGNIVSIVRHPDTAERHG
jgi:hypothetical protein